ncbi:MAG: hypothetical protein CM1200mP39_09360 [Dehalococcoidia bacterium]|nr:MAG: hypothetical protein CM1200mP39_09360 [Dehalococcoidia bacterium]
MTYLSNEIFNIRRRSITGIWLRHALAFVRYWKFVMTWVLVEPVIVLVAVGFGIGKLVNAVDGADSYAEFVTPGLIMGSAMFHALFETSWNAYNRIENDVYETALTAPITVVEVTLGDVLWAVTRSIMTTIGVASVAVAFGWLDGWLAFGILIPLQWWAYCSEHGFSFFGDSSSYNIFNYRVYVDSHATIFFFRVIFSALDSARLGRANCLVDAAYTRSSYRPRIRPRALGYNSLMGRCLYDWTYYCDVAFGDLLVKTSSRQINVSSSPLNVR